MSLVELSLHNIKKFYHLTFKTRGTSRGLNLHPTHKNSLLTLWNLYLGSEVLDYNCILMFYPRSSLRAPMINLNCFNVGAKISKCCGDGIRIGVELECCQATPVN